MIEKPQGSYISYFSNLVKLHGGVNLAQGIPGFQPPKELTTILAEIAKNDIHQYAPGLGNLSLLNQIFNRYAQSYNVSSERFLIVQGATEALSLVYTYLNKMLNGSFEVLSFEPAYESYSQLPKIFGQPFYSYPLNDEKTFNVHELKHFLTNRNVKVVFISSPGNPFGKVWSKQEVDTLLALAKEMDFYIVFDAVYSELYFQNKPHLPLDEGNERLFYVNSFSKMLCITGWRVGYLYAAKQHVDGLRSIHDYIGLCAPSVMQEALAIYLKENSFGEKFTHDFRKRLNDNFHFLSNELTALGFQVPLVDGGCFSWAKLPSGIDDGFQFAYALYHKTGLAIIPGEHFSSNHASWVRINIARPFVDIEKGAELLKRFLSNI